jgi:hypothetical protein
MKFQKNISIVFVIIATQCYSQLKKINGISFVSSSDSITQAHVSPVKKVYANYVALMPFGSMKSIRSTEIRFNSNQQWFGETEKGIKQYASQFKKNQIAILLKPQLWVWQGEYTGFILMDSDEDWEKLETAYEKFILHYASIAKELHVAAFCIGTELEKFVVNRPHYWTQLICKIREIYKGKLTYAANWDEFKRVPFWNDLDYIGIDAYFPLTNKKNPTVEDFKTGWKPHKEEIIRVQKQFEIPVLFTEFGYRSINFTGKEPWDSKRVIGEINLQAQVNGLQAIYNVFWKEDWFAGGFVWKWFHKYNEVGGNKNNRFTPQNKPAENVIKRLYYQ